MDLVQLLVKKINNKIEKIHMKNIPGQSSDVGGRKSHGKRSSEGATH